MEVNPEAKVQVGDMRSKLTGTGLVYGFTLTQIFKNKSNRVVFGIMLLIAAAAIPVASLFLGGGGPAEYTSYLDVSTVEEYLDGGQIGFETRYGVQYAYSIVAMIICIFSVTYIVRSIVEEKVSRLVETLMVSVRPLALVLGKILAVMTFIFSMTLAVAAVSGLSYMVSGMFLDVSFVGDTLASMGISMKLLELGPAAFAVILVSLLLAYGFFSLVAGLAGAGCSNMDEIESANMTAMWLILAGYLISCFAFGLTGGPVTMVMAICPVVSAFTVPAFFIFGDIGIGVVMISWLVEGVCILLLLLLTARVYDQLILYRGSRLKFRNILAMAAGESGRRGKGVSSGKRGSSGNDEGKGGAWK